MKCRNSRGERKRHGRQALIYAYWGYQPPSPESVFTTYRLRFGIESSYRQLHEGRIRTTTRRREARLLYVGIALVLRNLWVWLHYAILLEAAARRSGHLAGAAPVGDAVALVAPCGRGSIPGGRGRHLYRKRCAI